MAEDAGTSIVISYMQARMRRISVEIAPGSGRGVGEDHEMRHCDDAVRTSTFRQIALYIHHG